MLGAAVTVGAELGCWDAVGLELGAMLGSMDGALDGILLGLTLVLGDTVGS